MGKAGEEGTCVDKDFRVLGIDSLRVADMSVAPFLPRSVLPLLNPSEVTYSQHEPLALTYRPWRTSSRKTQPRRSSLSTSIRSTLLKKPLLFFQQGSIVGQKHSSTRHALAGSLHGGVQSRFHHKPAVKWRRYRRPQACGC